MTRLLLIALLAVGLLVAGCGGDDDGDATADNAAVQTQPTTTPATTDTTGDAEEAEDEQAKDEQAKDDDTADDGEKADDAGTDKGDAVTPPTKKGKESGGGSPVGKPVPAQLKRAIESCKENVRSASQLSKGAKDDLIKLCEKAAEGDPEELRRISREVCKRIIADTLPAGEQREAALKLCDQTAGSR